MNASRESRRDAAGEGQGAAAQQTAQTAQASDTSGTVSDRFRAAETKKESQEHGVAAAQGNREERLPINIEGEPRTAEKGDAAGQALRGAAAENGSDSDRAALREEAIRQILEEFLA